MRSCVILCVLLGFVVCLVLCQESSEPKAKQHVQLEQRPIGLSGRRRSRPLNSVCQRSRDCASKCCMKSGDKRRCSAKAKVGEPCATGQIKLDVYPDHCPCESGLGYCSSSSHICEAP